MAEDIGLNIKAYDNASGVLNRVSGRMGILNKQGIAMGIGFAVTHMAMQKVMQQFQKLKQHILDGVKSWREFEDAMAEVNTMLQGTSEKYLPEMRTAIEDLSIQWGKSANDMARGMYQVLSASVNAAQAIGVLGVAATASVAGLTSVETAVDAITTVLNAYGIGASRAAHISDVMFKTVQRGKLRFEELAHSLAFSVSLASKAGIAFEEVAAAMATMTKQGINASMAARGLRMVFADIITPSEEAYNAAKAYGITLDGLHLQVVGLEGIITELTDALGSNASIYAEIFPNVRSLSAILALTSENAKLFKEDIKAMFEDAGGASAQAALEIVESGGFMAKATEQTIEKQKRDLGGGWDEIVLGAQKTGASIVNALDISVNTLGMLGGMFTGAEAENLQPIADRIEDLVDATGDLWSIDKQVAATKAQLISEWYKGIAAAKDEGEQFKQNVAGAVAYSEANEFLNTTLEMTEEQLIANADAMDEAATVMIQNSEAFHEATDYVDGLSSELTTLKTTSVLLTKAIADLDTEIADLNEKIIQVSAIKTAEAALRGLEKQYKKLESAAWRYGMANKKLSIEMMQIELAAMGRRGRYTRSEKKQLADIQKEQLKNRIEQAKIGIEQDYFKAERLDPAMSHLADLRELQDTELSDLRATLSAKISDRQTYVDDLEITLDKELVALTKHLKAMRLLYAQYYDLGITPPGAVKAGLAKDLIKLTRSPISWKEKMDTIRGRQTGISRVGETGIYKLHEGETVGTKGASNVSGSGGGRVTVDLSGNLNVNVTRNIGAGDDPEAWVAKKISDGIRRGIIKTEIETMYG